jgi:phosphoglucosamine mutase
MGRLFGTDGVRGVANRDLTASLAFEIGRAAAFVLGKKSQRPVFVIGRDTRISGDMLENALAAGILSVGGNVIKLGVIPTPGVAYLVKHYDADAGVVISASHNSFEYNGIKIFNGEGFKLDDKIEEKIEDIILAHEFPHPEFIGDKLGKCLEAEEDALKTYTNFLLGTMDRKLDGVKVVIDPANGAAYRTAKAVYEALGADVIAIHDEPDGININDGCGSTHPEDLQAKVVETGADIGFAYDGDADRLIVVDEKGRLIDGDRVLCICGKKLKDEDLLYDDRIAATIMSNIGLHKHLEAQGIDVDVTKVGDRYVLESMLETGAVLGGEQSGHMIFLNYTTTGDGVLSSLQFMKAYLDSGKKAGELRDEIKIYPQALVNARVEKDSKADAMSDPEVLARVAEIEEKVKGTGRVLMRPSGTEPLIRVMIEGEDIGEIQKDAEYIADVIIAKYGDGEV